MNANGQYLDVTTMSLNEWLELMFNPPDGYSFIDYMFPTSNHLKEYIFSVNQRTDEEIKQLLRKLLIPSVSLGVDESRYEWLMWTKENDPNLYDELMGRESSRRLFLFSIGLSQIPPWEGITWTLDLLPKFPKEAIAGLKSYRLAHWQFLPDGRLDAMSDAIEIIRAKYIGIAGTQTEKVNMLASLEWREFEYIIEELYKRMGYETELTPPQKDGGRDIIANANRIEPGKLEHLLIECKKYVEEPVGISIVQRLLGVVSSEKVNKGVIVTTSRFTKPARQFAKNNGRIELLDGEQIVILMNEHLGPNWPLHL